VPVVIQHPLVGVPVEVINGGHGIKNPLLQNNALANVIASQQLGSYIYSACLRF